MKKFLGSIAGKITVISLAVLLLAAAGLGGYTYWHYQLVKFHDVSMELGQELPELSAFVTEDAILEKVRLVTPKEQIDLTLVGDQTLTFAHGSKTESVTLTITDTTPPVLKLQDVTADIETPLTAEDFVKEVFDLSKTTVDFTTPLTPPESYGDATVELVATDAHGNKTTATAFVYYVWMHKTFAMEIGDTVEKADLLLNPEKDGDKLDQAVLDEINASPVGTYTVTSTDGNQSSQCVITITDTVAPVLTLRAVSIDQNESVSKGSFISAASDASGQVTTTLLTKLDNTKLGVQEVVIEAMDVNGNKTTAKTTLTVHKDTKPPVFYGLKDMKIEKHSQPDYTAGVKAVDSKDGNVSFTYDDSKVDTSAAGIYYVVYTASDSNGNKVTGRRKVEVKRDAADTAALVDSIAASVGGSVEELRNYVRSSIYYSSSWGEDDPVWYGFKYKKGNCYVHAKCLDILLRKKGYTTQIIWCEDKSHYWNLVYINGGWKHIDSTPSALHGRYMFMNDAQRLETLSGRDWDREAWPECP